MLVLFLISIVSHSYLTALEEERVPDVEVCLDGNVVHEDAEEPVQGEHAGVHAVRREVGAQPRQLLSQQLLQHFLKDEENKTLVRGFDSVFVFQENFQKKAKIIPMQCF